MSGYPINQMGSYQARNVNTGITNKRQVYLAMGIDEKNHKFLLDSGCDVTEIFPKH